MKEIDKKLRRSGWKLTWQKLFILVLCAFMVVVMFLPYLAYIME